MRLLNAGKTYISDFFTKGHERTLEAKKNIAASFFIKGASIAINLALVPLTINYVNPTQYGIWLTLSSIVAWFSFFDIGFGHGLRNRFAEAKAKGDLEKARIYVSTTYAVLALIFTGVWLLFFAANFFIDWSKILNAPPELAEELSVVALIVFSFFCLQIVLKTLNTVIIADQKPAKAALFDMLGMLIALIAIFILTKTTRGSLVYLGLGLGAAPILILLLSSFIFYAGRYKYFAPSIKYVQFKYAKDIMALGIKFFIIQVSTILIYQFNNVIIINLFDAQKVTIYNIAYKYFFAANMVANIISIPFWSAFTEAFTNCDFTWMTNIYKKLNKIWGLLVLLIILMTLLSNIFYRYWIGEYILIPYSLSLLMAFNLIATTKFNLFNALLNGIGKIKLQFYLNIGLSFFSIPMTILFGRIMGLNGIVFANLIVSIIFSILTPWQVQKILEGRSSIFIFKKFEIKF